MARKVKKLPDGVVLIHYSKNGKIVSDLKLEDWFSNLVNIIVRTRKINKTLIVKVGTENMVHITRNLVTREILPPDMIRYRYGRRIFRIDAQGHWVGSPGKQFPKNFLGLTNKVRGKFLGYPDMFVRVPSNKKSMEPPTKTAMFDGVIKEAYKGLTSQEKVQNDMEASMLTGFYSSGKYGEGTPAPPPSWGTSFEKYKSKLAQSVKYYEQEKSNPYYPDSPKWLEFEAKKNKTTDE